MFIGHAKEIPSEGQLWQRWTIMARAQSKNLHSHGVAHASASPM